MNTRIILLVPAFALAITVAPAGAQTDAEKPAQLEQLQQKFREERAEFLAQVFEKRAELVRLSAQKQPDVERVQKLIQEVSELQDNQRKKCDEYRATMAVLGQPGVPDRPAMGLGGGFGLGRGQGRRAWQNQKGQAYGCPWGAPAIGRGPRQGRRGGAAPANGRGYGVGRGGRRQAPGVAPGYGQAYPQDLQRRPNPRGPAFNAAPRGNRPGRPAAGTGIGPYGRGRGAVGPGAPRRGLAPFGAAPNAGRWQGPEVPPAAAPEVN